MKRILILGWMTALLGPPLAAQDAAAAWQKLQARFAACDQGYKECYLAFRDEYQAFAASHAGTEEGLSAKLWLFQNTWWLEAGEKEKEALRLLDEILAEHPGSKQLAMIVEYRYALPAAKKQPTFLHLLETSPHPEVKAAALYGLGVEGLRSKEEEPRAAAKLWLERLAAEYGDLPAKYSTYGILARAHLQPHKAEDLEIGKPAPEISGADLDGKPMKLSDFRGKVVVLDFWGDW